MNRIGVLLLNIAAALYLFANGILGISQQGILGRRGGDFGTMIRTFGITGDLASVLVVILSVAAIVVGVFLLLSLLRISTPIAGLIDLILFIFVIVWAVFIVIVNIITPIQGGINNVWDYMLQLSSHLMVLGALSLSTRRLGGGS